MFGKYPGAYCIGLLRIGLIHIMIKIRYHRTSKTSSQLYFSTAFLSWLICQRGVIFRRAYSNKRLWKERMWKDSKPKILLCLFSSIQNCSTTIGSWRYFILAVPISDKKINLFFFFKFLCGALNVLWRPS